MAGHRKMVDLLIEETSGVDHPAHLHEGWLVIKSARPAEVWQALGAAPDKETGMDTLEKALQRLAEVEAENADLRKQVGGGDSTGDGVDEMLKALPEGVRAHFEQMQKDAADAKAKADAVEETLRKEREQRADEAAVAMVKSLAHLTIEADTVGPALRKVRDIDPALADEVEKALRAANAQCESADIFKQIGTPGHGAETDAYSRMEAMAKAAQAEDPSLTKAAAIAKVATENPDLYTQYQAEKAKG